ncbi:MAG: transposase [Bryobacterales bacterium]|nr:transposase [Bryobacterales bacterium]
MRRCLAGANGNAWYRKRKSTVVPALGWIRKKPTFRRFSLRGLVKVQGEWRPVCAALDLKRNWASRGPENSPNSPY